MTNFLLAGGGTAGHVNPLLALADEISRVDSQNEIFALGTSVGLESKLVPERGYKLLTVAKLPFPRKPNFYALRFPFAFFAAVNQVKKYIRENKIDIVVGFGGYASAPAYVAARQLAIPVVVHEANALPGFANKLGAKSAAAVAVTFSGTPIANAVVTGMPLRREIAALSLLSDKEVARKHFGLAAKTFTVLVTGGSLGAKKINETIDESRKVFDAAGVQILHIVGQNSPLPEVSTPHYVRIKYCDRMDLAIAAADFAISRAGSSTVSEFAAVGLPALYIPYAVGNGEQRLNITELLAAGGAETISDAEFDSNYVSSELIPLLSSSKKIAAMAKAAKDVGIVDGTTRLLKLIDGVLSRQRS